MMSYLLHTFATYNLVQHIYRSISYNALITFSCRSVQVMLNVGLNQMMTYYKDLGGSLILLGGHFE